MTKNNTNLKQTDIFSLFGIEDEYAITQQKEEEERLKKQQEIAKNIEESKKNTSTAKSTADTFEVNADTIIYFYTETIQITDYFTTEELENGLPKKGKDNEIEYKKITESDVKIRLKKDYPVIEAGAELVYIKKKNIISIILKAKKKGNINCSLESDSKSDSIPSTKKIPFSLLQDFIAISKYFSDQYGTEVHGEIFYNTLKDEFFLDIPKQQANVLSVEVTEDSTDLVNRFFGQKVLKVMEIHSHHLMYPTPSPRDDLNERMPILYAIVGRVNNFFPEVTVRAFSFNSGRHIPLEMCDVFENPFRSVPEQYDLSVVEVV